MELKVIEEKTFERLKMCIMDLLVQVDTLLVEPNNDWIDNQTVCQALGVSLAFTQNFGQSYIRFSFGRFFNSVQQKILPDINKRNIKGFHVE